MIPLDRALEELQAGFDAPPDALERCAEILEVQYLSLAKDPPLARLPDSVRLAAVARMRAGEPVMPPERVPIEERRVIEVVRALARTLLDDDSLDVAAPAFVNAALPPVLAGDIVGTHAAAARLDLEPEAAVAILRESLKPEMLRTSSAFRGIAHDAGQRRRCPLCGDRPCGATESGQACCRWCGLVFPWDASACGACDKAQWREHELSAIVRHARMLRCAACGELVKAFRVSPEPLLISLFGVLTAPFDLAAHVAADDVPMGGFAIF